MSQVSVLSQEYKTASELSRAVNTLVIELKKAHQGLPSVEKSHPSNLSAERRRVGDLLVALASLLDPSAGHDVSAPAAHQVSGALVSRLRTEKGGELAYYVHDLRETASRLDQDPCRLTDVNLALLDHLAATASAETSRVYRRLMRK